MATVVMAGKEESHVYLQVYLSVNKIVNDVTMPAIPVVVQDTVFLHPMDITASQPPMLPRDVRH